MEEAVTPKATTGIRRMLYEEAFKLVEEEHRRLNPLEKITYMDGQTQGQFVKMELKEKVILTYMLLYTKKMLFAFQSAVDKMTLNDIDTLGGGAVAITIPCGTVLSFDGFGTKPVKTLLQAFEVEIEKYKWAANVYNLDQLPCSG